MYKNIGEKIKGLAIALFIVDAVLLVVAGLIVIFQGVLFELFGYVLLGFLIALAGPFIAWVSSWLRYGFGELINKTTEIAENTNKKKEEKQEYQGASSYRI